MSFFDTEESHAVVPAKGKDEGGRSASQVLPRSPHMDICNGDGRPP
jgi:hypothetical protein